MRFLLGLLLLVSTASEAGVFETRFLRIVRDGEVNLCQQMMEQFAEKFTNTTGKQVVDYGCEVDELVDRIDGVIVYVSDTYLPRVSTYTASTSATAIYSSKAACEAALPRQEQIFTQATGLEPVAAFCMPEFYSQAYTSRVDGFGESPVRARTFSLRFENTISDLENVVHDLKVAGESRQMIFSEIGTAVSIGYGAELVVRVFSVNAYTFDDYSELTYETLDECKVDQGQVRNVILDNVESVFTFCQFSPTSGASKLHIVSIHNLLTSNDVLQIRKLPRQYETAATCQAFASGLADPAEGILGGLCALDAGHYYVHMFATPNWR